MVLAPDRAETGREVPLLTRREFRARKQAFERDERRGLLWLLVALGPFYGAGRFLVYLDGYAKRTKLPDYILALVGFVVIGAFLATIYWLIRGHRRLWRKHGLLCPACGRHVTDTVGLIEVPFLGLCKHCGAKIIE